MAISPHYKHIRDTSVDNSNQVVKIGGGEVAYFQGSNGGVVDAYLHFYDALTANVTVGTTVPTYSFLIPAGTAATTAGAYEYTGPPLHFEIGCVYAAVTDMTGSTNPSVKPALGLLLYR